uniref:Alpha-type protein kinase domain-containing protein n=1 Tax=Mucochytrium quahogii TaxID=96639 RepID=A0A7S2RID9_9STRA|mmetsp:Transcript_4438/g.6626  ORF Transcript_4438/g.6626 Transcript_4438/m.6626 type:complete len:636 (+) Transcript_4438:411-2318(+)|eukprot:CAMPEP_0203749884 /NCGR_PEP_ID=MMETSP0098-20131031/4260_1 /ASSEMBLY_ACC=CAM_ASM_000208 /TAXON_ID=96639 /ORGANISM=" , Strain NY0313808BC1" /LENGTH=635 /DNA_ID=CAMNT_0050639001 /DNA_START=401 /DNA_END=2308 /DNA_ORIENTATION=+
MNRNSPTSSIGVLRKRRGPSIGVAPIQENEVEPFSDSPLLKSTNQSCGDENTFGVVDLDGPDINLRYRSESVSSMDNNGNGKPKHVAKENGSFGSNNNNNSDHDLIKLQETTDPYIQSCGEDEHNKCAQRGGISFGNEVENIQGHRKGNLRVAPRTGLTADKFSKLQNLEALYEQGFILATEYKERRLQLVDELTGTRSVVADTGTSCSSTGSATPLTRKLRQVRRRKSRVSSSIVVPRPPPDFSMIPTERAIKHYFDLSTRTWNTEELAIRLDDTPFARGGLRLVYHLQEARESDLGRDLLAPLYFDEDKPFSLDTITAEDHFGEVDTLQCVHEETTPEQTQDPSERSTQDHTVLEEAVEDNGDDDKAMNMKTEDAKKRRRKKTTFVAKIAIDPNEDPSTYFRDVEMQAHCAHYARLFNTYDPPRLVEFCKAWILELVDREGSPLCAVERFVAGDYRKHNNNYGYVSEDERNTPQAFSHFSYEASAHTMLVVDIQGVSDMYTDPQIHTINGTDFGKGNLGIKGFDRFLKTHRCNRICRYLKLPPVNPKYSMEGTVPNLPFMPATKINKRHFKEGHYFEENPQLQKYLSANNIIKPKGRRRRIKRLDSDEDSFLRFWETREAGEGICSFCPCSVL